MKKFIAFIVLAAIIVGGYLYQDEVKKYIEDFKNGTTDEKIVRETELLLREYPPKKVEIFELGKDLISLDFTKTGTANAKTIIYVSPQVAGKITDVNVEVGDKVKENDTIIKLGESLSTDVAEIQYLAAKEGLEIATKTLSLTKKANIEALESAQLGIQSAKETYENSKNTKSRTAGITNEQIDSAELALEIAKEAYEDLKDNYEDAKDAFNDLEDQYDDLKAAQPDATEALAELKAAIAQAETGLDTLKAAKKSSSYGAEQSELGLEQLERSVALQIDQLKYAIEMACIQYKLAVNQLESLEITTQLQVLGIKGQIVQADSSYEMAKLNREYQNVKAPIDGTVTSLSAEEGNLSAPGQILATIENLDKFLITTAVNQEEATLLKVGDEVKVEGEKGKIISISPSLNQMTKKIDVEIEVKRTPKINSGSFVKVVFSPQPKKIVFVPLNSVTLTSEGKVVKTIDDELAVECKPVVTGQIIGNYIEITEGLKGNEKIVTSITTLEEGEKVALL